MAACSSPSMLEQQQPAAQQEVSRRSLVGWVQRFLDVPEAAVAGIKRLCGYEDTNWMIELAGGQRYLLKLHNAQDSQDMPLLQAQNAVMAHAAATGITTSVPVAARGGTLVQAVQLQGRQHVLRLLEWVPGEIMGTGRQRSLGAALGRLTLSLASFDHPALHRQHDWSMATAAATIKRKLPGIARFSEQQRDDLAAAAQGLEEALARLQHLPQQVCHADGNEANLLVNPERTQVVGIIDWGDACWGPRVTEVAIAMTYIMLLEVQRQLQQEQEQQGHQEGQLQPEGKQQHDQGRQQLEGQLGQQERQQQEGQQQQQQEGQQGWQHNIPRGLHNPLDAAAHVLAGFIAACTLSQDELIALPPLLRGRVALSLTNGAAAAAADPGNSDYVLITQRPGWALMAMLRGVGDSALLERLLAHARQCSGGGGGGSAC